MKKSRFLIFVFMILAFFIQIIMPVFAVDKNEKIEEFVVPQNKMEIKSDDIVIIDENYMLDNQKCYSFVPIKDVSRVYFSWDELQKYDEGDTVRLFFTVNIKGLDAKYSPICFLSDGDILADEVIKYNTWTKINLEVKILVIENIKYVSVAFSKCCSENLYLSDIKISNDIIEDNLLDGAELWQLPSHSKAVWKEQQMSYVIITKEKQVIVIDGGVKDDKTYLVSFLKKYTNKVDAWFITHYHSDHIGALSEIMEDDSIEINKIYYDFPDDELIRAIDGGISTSLTDFRNNIDKYNTQKIGKGDEFTFGSMSIEVLNDLQNNIISNFGNETTIAFKMKTANKSVLFLGDAGIELGKRLLKWQGNNLKCDIVQMAHHGQNGVDEELYKFINPKICLYCAPDWLWYVDSGEGLGSRGESTLVTKDWMRKIGVYKNVVAYYGLAVIK